MLPTDPNPYAAPQLDPTAPAESNPDLKRIEAVIKDAGQFWLAILLCIFCSGLGAVIIGPWYLVRLLQWHSIAKTQPMLLDQNAPRGSLAQRFQSARWKLIAGICFGGLMLVLTVVYVVLVVSSSKGQP